MQNKKIVKLIACTAALSALLFLVSLLALCVGTAHISIGTVIDFVLHADIKDLYWSILFDIRLPRILLGFAVGSALSLSGVILQGMFRNPLVEPYTLGISGGAALGVCLCIALHLDKLIGMMAIPFAGLIGAGAVIILIYVLSMRKGLLNMQGLLLSGVMISFICASLFMLIMALARAEDLHGIIFWTMGSLEQSSWFLIKSMTCVSILGLFAAYVFSKKLNAFSLGHEEAQHLGVEVERTKKILFVVTSVLTGCSVAVAGIIGFVGLIIPHLMRQLVGSDHRLLLICSYIAGGIFLILSDTIARTIISPLELPVGVITGIIGGITFIFALTYRRKGE